MIIGVLADLGGERLLGKAREIADSQGYGVLAICPENKKSDANRLIGLGADEVQICQASDTADWIGVLSDLIKARSAELRILLLPSNILANFILGGLCIAAAPRVGQVLDCAESVSEFGASKSLKSVPAVLSVRASEDKVSIYSVSLAPVPEPFEDSARYGKIGTFSSSLKEARHARSIPISDFGSPYLDSSTRLTLIVGRNCRSSPKRDENLKKIASRYEAIVVKEEEMSGRVVYGACLAIEVSSPVRDLPELQGTVISINSDRKSPISQVADVAVISQDIDGILERLLLESPQ